MKAGWIDIYFQGPGRFVGYRWQDTIALWINRVTLRFFRLIGKFPKNYDWWHFPVDLEGRLFWAPYLEAWVDIGARLWAITNEPPSHWYECIRPDSVGMDIGAARGYWSLRYTRHIQPPGMVFLWEPFPANYGILLKNLGHNGLKYHIPLPIAASDSTGRLNFFEDPTPMRGIFEGKVLADSDLSSSRAHFQVMGMRVDDFVRQWRLPKIDWIKVDVEGHELHVLRGAYETLREHRPILWVEVSAENEAEYLEEMNRLGYEVRDKHMLKADIFYYWHIPRYK